LSFYFSGPAAFCCRIIADLHAIEITITGRLSSESTVCGRNTESTGVRSIYLTLCRRHRFYDSYHPIGWGPLHDPVPPEPQCIISGPSPRPSNTHPHVHFDLRLGHRN
jgi:hypothetical protein